MEDLATSSAAAAGGAPARAGAGPLSEKTASLIRLFDRLHAFEAEWKTETWAQADLHTWPIVKYLSVYLVSQKYASGPDGLERFLSATEAGVARARQLRLEFDAASAAALIPQPPAPKASVFVGNTVTLKPVGGVALQLNYDYLRVAMEAAGQPTHSLLYGMRDEELRAQPSLLPHHSLEPVFHFFKANPTVKPLLNEQPGMRDLTAFLGALLGVDAPARLLSFFNFRLTRVFDWVRAWEIWLRAVRAAACSCFNYTSPPFWGLSLAARRIAIPCYEIQHGIQGRLHGAYHWTRVPPGGWSSVPNGRLIWSGAELDTVYPACLPEVTGPGSLQTVAMLMDPRLAAWSPAIASAREQLLGEAEQAWQALGDDRQPRVLFLSDRPTDVDMLGRLVAQDRHRYLFRFHPAHDSLPWPDDVRALLVRSMADHFTRLPLPFALAAADVTLSNASASFIEARYFGVPAVFMSDYARTLRSTYGGTDLIESSAEHCGRDIAALHLARNPAAPRDRLMATLDALPDVREIVTKLVG
jgi:hypothetical protein